MTSLNGKITADEAVEMCLKVAEAMCREEAIVLATCGKIGCSEIEPKTFSAVNRFRGRLERAKLEVA